MAVWRLKGEIVFGTTQGRATFLANHDTWRVQHAPLLVDIVRSLDSENGQSTGNMVRIDAAIASAGNEVQDYYNAIRALPTIPFTRAFVSIHRCSVDGTPGQNITDYYEFP